MRRSLWQYGIKTGLIAGVIAVLLSLIGMVEAFSRRDIISGVISMGHTLLLLVGICMGFLAAKRTLPPDRIRGLINSLVTGLLVGGSLLALVILGRIVHLRSIFIN